MLVVNMALFLVQRTVFVYFPGPDIELECTSLAQGIKRLCDHIRIQNSAKKKKKKKLIQCTVLKTKAGNQSQPENVNN